MSEPMTPRDVLLSMLSAAEAMAEGEKISLIAALVDIERDSIVAGRQAWMDAQREGLDRESALRARVAELETLIDQKERCQCSDSEACAFVRRIEELEDVLAGVRCCEAACCSQCAAKIAALNIPLS